jgi:hypothetical protein
VWGQESDGYLSIWANHFVPATGWATAQLIESDDVPAGAPQITVDDLGNVTVVWRRGDPARHNVWARFVPGTGWSPAQVIETDDRIERDLGVAGAAVDAAGNTVAVWTQAGDAPPGVTRRDVWAGVLP